MITANSGSRPRGANVGSLQYARGYLIISTAINLSGAREAFHTRTHSGNHARHDNDTRVYKAPITSYYCREDPLISAMSPSSAIERSHKEVPDDDRTTIKDTGDSQEVFVDDEEHDIQYKTLSWEVRPNWALLSSGAD